MGVGARGGGCHGRTGAWRWAGPLHHSEALAFVEKAVTEGVPSAVAERDGPFQDYSQRPRGQAARSLFVSTVQSKLIEDLGSVLVQCRSLLEFAARRFGKQGEDEDGRDQWENCCCAHGGAPSEALGRNT